MLQKKICMLGAFGVGKTSLVSTFTGAEFRGDYTTTVGVRINQKNLIVNHTSFNLLIWDIAGEDDFQTTPEAYLNGTAGYILVADVTRRETFVKAREIQRRMQDALGDIPFVFVLNKFDLTQEWDIDRDLIDRLLANNWQIVESSARTGMGVEKVFNLLAQQILGQGNGPLSFTSP
ncbi:MAG TPA: Rab family GTPase [Calditrichia bacterium]|nr:GTP-binding protein [Calditrichota bacterium]HQU71307.1 Rab family GTPase [Calditrichia bacterium]HQV33234.1 Rab family GTPase [Calditrichia bacterium]